MSTVQFVGNYDLIKTIGQGIFYPNYSSINNKKKFSSLPSPSSPLPSLFLPPFFSPPPGQFGKVKLARHALTNEIVAVKIIHKSQVSFRGRRGEGGRWEKEGEGKEKMRAK